MSHACANVVVLALLIGAGAVAGLVSPVLASAAAAQSVTASVSGTVYDQQHGVLPGATLTVKHLETGQVRWTIHIFQRRPAARTSPRGVRCSHHVFVKP